MQLVASLSVVRMRGESCRWWPERAERLVVVVLEAEPTGDMLVAYGVAPSPGGRRSQIVWQAEVRRSELGSLTRALMDGDGDLTVVTNPDPASAISNLVFTLAAALHIDQQQAEFVAQQASRRAQR